jgi:hypothetical protein
LSDKENRKPTIQVRELLWHGNINGIANLVRENLARRKSAAEAALKKLTTILGSTEDFNTAYSAIMACPRGVEPSKELN